MFFTSSEFQVAIEEFFVFWSKYSFAHEYIIHLMDLPTPVTGVQLHTVLYILFVKPSYFM